MKKKKSLSPFIIILLSFFIVIVVGTILLLLPFSSKGKNLTFIEALFTTTSAVCVTGLSVIPDLGATLSVFGIPKRTANGLDYNRLAVLIAVLEKRANLNIGGQIFM